MGQSKPPCHLFMPVMASSAEELVLAKNKALWVPDERKAWTEARLVSCTKTPKGFQLVYHAEDDPSVERTVLVEGPLMMRNTTMNESRLDNLTELTHLNEPAVLHTIRERYLEDDIYTYSGIVLVSINPYRRLDLYSNELIWTFKGRIRAELEPHLFAIAEEAFKSLAVDQKSQSIIVSGESGAGKTISAKYIMRYLAEVCKQQTNLGGIESRILATNPILEAFGNAKTARNDNSSRFGKYVQILFNKDNQIIGATIRTFLLEKTRVVDHAPVERNYHIFYQMLAGLSDADLKALGLENSGLSYAYLGHRNARIDGVNDREEFDLTKQSLTLAGFTDETQLSIFTVLAAILHIGNIRIDKDAQDYATIDKHDLALHEAARFLKIDPILFSKWICKRLLKAGNEVVETSLSVSQAISARDSVSRHLYDLLFDFIISSLNTILRPEKVLDQMLFIGVLDIYGFEKFEKNSFEQFCINYANEKLQYQFNQQVFRIEQELYESEGINWSFINFNDNKPCIEMLEGKQGILRMLAEECRVPNGSDKQLAEKINQRFDESVLSRNKFATDQSFTVKHFAYDVTYDINSFLEKNRDTFPEEQLELLRSSRDSFVASLFEQRRDDSLMMSQSGSKESLAAREAIKNTGLSFKSSLNELMNVMSDTKVYYIRCIKPNQEKEPLSFDAPFVVQQLRACGIIETIRISAAGFPGRWSFADFITRYRIIVPEVNLNQSDHLEACGSILEAARLGEEDYQIGNTRVFLRAGVLGRLEDERTTRLQAAATLIQSISRAQQQRQAYLEKINAIKTLQQTGRIVLARKAFKSLCENRAAKSINCAFKMLQARSSFKDALAQATCISACWKLFQAKQTWAEHQKGSCAELLLSAFRGWKQREHQSLQRSAASTITRGFRFLAGKNEAREIRKEARSLAKLIETSSGLERKILELSGQLQASEISRNAIESKLLAALEENKRSNQTCEDLKDEADTFERRLEEANERLDALKSEHEATLSELRGTIEEQSQTIVEAEEARETMENRIAGLEKQIEFYKTNLAAHRKEDLQTSFTLPDRTMSTTDILRSHDDKQRDSPIQSRHHLRKLSMDSKLGHIAELDLPHFELGARKRLDQADPVEVLQILQDTKLIEELHEMAQYSAGFDPRRDQSPSILRLPAVVLEHWIATWLELEPEPLRLGDQFHNLLGTIKNLCLRSIHANEGPLTSDQKYAFWLANLVQMLGSLQHRITKLSNTDSQDPPNLVVIDKSEAQGMTTSLVVLLQMRSEAARAVEELFRNWLSELCKWFSRLGPAAIMDHQGLHGYDTDQQTQKPATGSRFLDNLLGRRSSNSPQLSTEVLLDGLDQLVGAMLSSELQSELAEQILGGVMSQIFAIAFNELLVRRAYATWRRGIQIQYNLSQLEDWASRLRSSRPTWLPGPPLSASEPLLQAVKLLQLAKTATTEDLSVILEACPSLNTHQIRRILSVYVPDEFEDGPVCPALMRALALRCQQDELGEQPGDLMRPEVKPEAEPLQFSIKPISPSRLNVPVSLVPPTLWRLFVLFESLKHQ